MKNITTSPSWLQPPKAIDTALFERACKQIIGTSNGQNGIGTLNEKTIHAVLKSYYSPAQGFHEQRINSYVADIMVGDTIIEIQTRNFNTMRKKLEAFLPEHPVTIVYPVAYTKWLSWIDPTTGEVSPKRKSPKAGTPYRIFPELYRIKSFLTHPNLNFTIVLLEVEEYRLLNGWSYDKKRGSYRNDGIPVGLIGEVHIRTLSDYKQLLPEDLPEAFTTKDYQKAAKVTASLASVGVNILYHVGVIERIGKQGQFYLYRKS